MTSTGSSQDAEGSLRALETILAEFFAAPTTNHRKREIEALLNDFASQTDSWRHALYFLAKSNNDYVLMYAMTVVENTINKSWPGLRSDVKTHIRDTLTSMLLERHDHAQYFVRNKLSKLIVDIGRLDWPHFYPDFMDNIFLLIQSPSTTLLGMILLQTASEELVTPRSEEIAASRKEELKKLLLAQAPTALTLVAGVLDGSLEKALQRQTSTPPPSPTNGHAGESATPFVTPHASGRNTPTFGNAFSSPPPPSSLLTSIFQSPAGKHKVEWHAPPLDSDMRSVCAQALVCLTQLFSWMPLSNVTPSILSTIFQFVAYGLDPTPTVPIISSSTKPSSAAPSYPTIATLAMCCVNELLAKNCVPREFESYLLLTFQQTFYLLQRFTKEGTQYEDANHSASKSLENIDEAFLEKCTEFLRLFVGVHLRRFEASGEFPMLEFLSLLFKFTFKQPTPEGFYACLEIWNVFLDYVNVKMRNKMSNDEKSAFLGRYRPALESLSAEILQKLQFKYNQSQLEELDDEVYEDGQVSDWQTFLRECVEVVSKISELLPAQVFGIVYPAFEELLNVYIGLGSFVHKKQNGERELTIVAENECRKLHCSLRDLSSLLQTMGRLADHFVGENFQAMIEDGKTLVHKIVSAAIYGSEIKLYKVTTVIQSVLVPDFVEVHAQSLAAVQAFCPWLAQFQLMSKQSESPSDGDAFFQAIKSGIELSVPLFEKDTPPRISLASAHLLRSVTATVRPHSLVSVPAFQSLFTQLESGSFSHLQRTTYLVIFQALSNHLLLPYAGVAPDGEQNWSVRSTQHALLLKNLTYAFTSACSRCALGLDEARNTLVHQHKDVILSTLELLKELVHSVENEGMRSKQICCQSIRDATQAAISIFPVIIQHHELSDATLGFFLVVVEGLHAQIGVPLVEQMLRTFLVLFTREQLSAAIANENALGCAAIEKFLQILRIVIQQPGATFKSLMPNILNLSVDEIYPIVAQQPSPLVKGPLFNLFHHFLLHNWRMFFKMPVAFQFKMVRTENEENEAPREEVQYQEHFVKILQAFGQSFLQPDINIFRQNVAALENLNSKWKLYSKQIFREMMSQQFLQVLIGVLILRSHDLLQEEIHLIVFNMASVDFPKFFSRFLPAMLMQTENLDHNQKTTLATHFKRQEEDLPTFVQNLTRFVNDLRYYQLCNSRLPAGSVSLNETGDISSRS